MTRKLEEQDDSLGNIKKSSLPGRCFQIQAGVCLSKILDLACPCYTYKIYR